MRQKRRVNTHSYHAILFNFIAKESIFCSVGHAKAYSRDKKEDNFAIKLNLVKALQIFVSGLSNHLALATASPCVIFKPIYQKFNWRRMGDNYAY